MEYFTSGKVCNPEKNLIVAYCKIQLENESKMNKKPKHLLYYHFLNFMMSTRIIPGIAPTASGFSFIDFLKNYIQTRILKKFC